jgi:hypothetical protein
MLRAPRAAGGFGWPPPCRGRRGRRGRSGAEKLNEEPRPVPALQRGGDRGRPERASALRREEGNDAFFPAESRLRIVPLVSKASWRALRLHGPAAARSPPPPRVARTLPTLTAPHRCGTPPSLHPPCHAPHCAGCRSRLQAAARPPPLHHAPATSSSFAPPSTSASPMRCSASSRPTRKLPGPGRGALASPTSPASLGGGGVGGGLGASPSAAAPLRLQSREQIQSLALPSLTQTPRARRRSPLAGAPPARPRGTRR